jgi:hypothetical protein
MLQTARAMLPFTPEQFHAVFSEYNAAIWPIQVIAYGLGLLSVLFLVQGTPRSGRWVAGALGAMWIWTGVAYHWLFFAPINSAAFLFGALFVAQGIIFLWAGLHGGRFRFGYAGGVRASLGMALILYAAAFYPLIGIALGRTYAELPQFGVTPCPLVIFTLGCLLLSTVQVDWWILAIPLAWSLIGGVAALLLDVPQDLALPLGGAITTLLVSKASQISARPRTSM